MKKLFFCFFIFFSAGAMAQTTNTIADNVNAKQSLTLNKRKVLYIKNDTLLLDSTVLLTAKAVNDLITAGGGGNDSAYVSGAVINDSTLRLYRDNGDSSTFLITGRATPTWQETLTAGSTLTTNNISNLSGNYFYMINGSMIALDAGRISIGGVTNDSTVIRTDSLIFNISSKGAGKVLISDADGGVSFQAPSALGLGNITGTLTTNTIPKATGANTLGNSQIFDDGTNVGINKTSSFAAKLDVLGSGTSTLSMAARLIGGTSSGAGGLYLGAFNSTYGGFWSANVTPSLTNYSLISNGAIGIVNGTSNVNLAISDATKVSVAAASTTISNQLISSAAGAASTSAVFLTGNPSTAGTTTTDHPLFYMNGGTAPTTWSDNGTYLGVNAVSGFTGNYIDMHLNGGASGFKVDYSGTVTISNQFVAGSHIQATGGLTAGTGQSISWNSGSIMKSPSSGVITMYNNGSTDFTRLQLGGTTSSFPAIVREGTGIGVVDATGVSYTPLKASVIDGTSYIRSPVYVGGTTTTSTLTLQTTSGSGTTGSDIIFKDDNTEWMRILNNGNVGIGTTSPTKLLQVGTINPVISLKQATSAQQYDINIGLGTGLSSQKFEIKDVTSGIPLFAASSGASSGPNVAIGTTTPYASSSLYVTGGSAGANIDAQANGTSSRESNIEAMAINYSGGKGIAMRLWSDSLVSGATVLGNAKQHLALLDFNEDLNIIRTNNTNPLIFGINDAEKARLDVAGTLTAVTLKTTPVAFASLPTGAAGMVATINDSNTDVWGATAAGGGALTVMIFFNGTNWTVIGK